MNYKYQQIKIDGLSINCASFGDPKGHDIVFLHGWGQNIQTMFPLANGYKTIFNITIIDLPGFGCSSIPDKALTIYEYTEIVKKLLDKLKINDPIIVGHSFGGRIGIIYASKYKVAKLVLLASPFEKEEENKFKVKILKGIAKVPGFEKIKEWAKNHMGSTDYKNASPLMREILVSTVNTNLEKEAKSINCETLMIWGDNDQAVNVKEAYKLNKLIHKSKLVVFKNRTHYAYLEDINKTLKEMDSFLNKESRENI